MLSLRKKNDRDLQKDLAFFTLESVEAIIHLTLDKMLAETVERVKYFFETEHACIHFYPSIGLTREIETSGLKH